MGYPGASAHQQRCASLDHCRDIPETDIAVRLDLSLGVTQCSTCRTSAISFSIAGMSRRPTARGFTVILLRLAR